MFTLLRTLSFGFLRQRWTRTILLVASIALGVATLVATRSLHETLKRSAREAITPMSSVADVVIVNGQSGLPAALLPKLREPAIPGITEIQPIVVARAAVPELDNAQTWVLGLEVDPARADSLASSSEKVQIDIEWKHPPDSAAFAAQFFRIVLSGQVPALISGPLADRLTGDRARLRAAGREQTLGVLGRVRLRGDLSVLGENVVFTTLTGASAFVSPDRPDTLTQINVKIEPGTDRAAIMAELQQRVGYRGRVRTAEANEAQYMEVAAGLELGFLLGSAGALVVGVFLIYNALSVSVAERRHDIGILRSVGATRGQIAGLFVTEAFFLGLLGSLLGLPVGYWIARGALVWLAGLLSDLYVAVNAKDLLVSGWTLGLAFAAGVGTAVLAALVPAIQAAREEPADAVRRVPSRSSGILAAVHVAAIVLLFGGGLFFTLYRDQLPPRFGAFAGIVCLLVGALVATPIAAAFVGRLLQPFTRHLLGLEGRLAADNLIRSPARTGLVIAALAATTALVLQTAGFIHSSKIAVLGWIDQSIAADLFVTSGADVTKLGITLPMNTQLARDIEKEIPGVAAVVPVRFHRVDFRDRLVFLLAVDLEALRGKNLKHNPARDLEENPELIQPGVASVSENFAALYGVKPGEQLTIPGPTEPITLKIHGTYPDFSWNRGTLLVNQAWYQKTFGERVADAFDVHLERDADPVAVRSAILERWGKSDSLYATACDTFKSDLSRQLDNVYLFAYAQQGVVGLVALLGVMSALLISVLQRRRELGLLRAVGASRPQVLRSVLAEAGLMGFIGALIGVLVGLVLEWYVIRILILDESGFLFPVAIPWREMIYVALLALLLPLLVGIWPALQATRIRIADAIAYE